jgi:hypothetical protein
LSKINTTQTTPPVKAVFNEITKFQATQQKYKEFGACDTEPDGVFQWLVDQAVKGLKPDIPRTGAKWDLYDSSMDCTEAARALHDQALNVITAIEACPVRDLDLLRSKLQEYCWRLY